MNLCICCLLFFYFYFYFVNVHAVSYTGNKIGNNGMKQFADMLKVNTTLTFLNMACESIQCLFVLFFQSVFLFKTDMFINDIRAKYIAEALSVNTTLTALTLFGE